MPRQQNEGLEPTGKRLSAVGAFVEDSATAAATAASRSQELHSSPSHDAPSGPRFKDQVNDVEPQSRVSSEVVRDAGRERSQEAPVRDTAAHAMDTIPAIVEAKAVTAQSTLLSETDESLYTRVTQCETIDDLGKMYQDKFFQMALERIEKEQEGAVTPEQLEDWAKNWALARGSMDHSSDAYQKAFQLDSDRRACLEFLKVMCREHFDNQGNETPDAKISKSDIVRMHHPIKRILASCLVMTRAQVLYKMKRFGPYPVGMHWYSAEHEQSSEFDTEGFREWNEPTLSSKYMFLWSMEELGLRKEKWLQRVFAPQRRVGSDA